MTVKIKIKKDTVKATDFNVGDLFLDSDGDLYLRGYDGCVGIATPDELTPYTNNEIADYDLFPYLEHCTPVTGTIKIKIKLEI
jgi:hypothetical protein